MSAGDDNARRRSRPMVRSWAIPATLASTSSPVGATGASMLADQGCGGQTIAGPPPAATSSEPVPRTARRRPMVANRATRAGPVENLPRRGRDDSQAHEAPDPDRGGDELQCDERRISLSHLHRRLRTAGGTGAASIRLGPRVRRRTASRSGAAERPPGTFRGTRDRRWCPKLRDDNPARTPGWPLRPRCRPLRHDVHGPPRLSPRGAPATDRGSRGLGVPVPRGAASTTPPDAPCPPR